MVKFFLVLVTTSLPLTPLFASHEPWTVTEFPQDINKLWWDDDWWENGKIPPPENHEVIMEITSYSSGDAEIPAYVFRPKKPGNYFPVLFQHGRRGLDDLTLLAPRRLAARGFIVFAPDVWNGRFLDRYPMGHDYVSDKDVARGIEALLQQPGLLGTRACVVSHTRGGYMTLKALVTHGKQQGPVACYIAFYPHWQDPNKPEPMQVYQYAPEIDDLVVPVLVFFGEHEQYQRLRPILEGIKSLEEKGRYPQLIVYPGVGRGFDFRPPRVRTFADDLATRDALQRSATFIRRHLGESISQ